MEFRRPSGVGQVLLVGEDEKGSVAELVVREHVVENFGTFLNALAVGTVDDEDDGVSSLVVVSPKFAKRGLTTDIPQSERKVLVLNGFDVKTNCWDGGFGLAELELTEDCSLTSSVKLAANWL